MFNLFRLCRKDEISFDIVAKKRQQCRSNIRLCRKNRSTCTVAFDSVAPALLLVWTGLYRGRIETVAVDCKNE